MTNPKHTSSDLVEWLRRTVYRNSYYKDDTRVLVNPDGPEAADRIEALEAEVERLREALEPFTFREDGDDEAVSIQHPSIIVRCEVTYGDIQLARAALEARHD